MTDPAAFNPLILIFNTGEERSPAELSLLDSAAAPLAAVRGPLLGVLSLARASGFTHVLTLPPGGMLNATQVNQLLAAASQRPRAVIVGCSEEQPAGLSHSLARRLSAGIVLGACGARLPASASRIGHVWPLRLSRLVRPRGGGYVDQPEAELELLVRSAWAGVPVDVVMVPPSPQAWIHKRLKRLDVIGLAIAHVWLLWGALSPWPGPRLQLGAPTGRAWPRLARWMSPRRAWRELRSCHPSHRSRFAVAVGLGAFIANLPAYGAQTLLCLYAAKKFRLHPLPILLGCQISTPPLGPLLVAAAIAVGHVILHGTPPQLSWFDPRQMGYLTLLRSVLLEWAIGSVICGIVCGLAAFAVTRLLLRWVPSRPHVDLRVLSSDTTTEARSSALPPAEPAGAEPASPRYVTEGA